MPEIIAISNLKGGCAKSSTALALSAFFAKKGYKTLLIDADPQANSTQGVGARFVEVSEYEDTISTYFERIHQGEKANPKPVRVSEKLHLIPSNIEFSLADAKYIISADPNRILKDIISEIEHNYDVIIIDSLPSIGLIGKNILTAANWMLIPVSPQSYFDFKGIQLFIDSVAKWVIKKLNNDLAILGILLTKAGGNSILERDLADSIKETFPKYIFNTRIRRNVAISESQAKGVLLPDYDPESNGAKDYEALTDEIIDRLEI